MVLLGPARVRFSAKEAPMLGVADFSYHIAELGCQDYLGIMQGKQWQLGLQYQSVERERV